MPARFSLLSAIQDTGAKSFRYDYNFGDGWTNSIKIERTFPIIALADPVLIGQQDAARLKTQAALGTPGVP